MMKVFDKLLNNSAKEQEPEEPKEQRKRLRGRIIKVSPEGYMFITSKEVPFTRLFGHWTSLVQDTLKFDKLTVGMTVEFEHHVVDKKDRAIRIKVIENESQTEAAKTA